MISSVHLTTCNQSTSKKYSLTEIRGAREASLIQKGRTIDPDGLNSDPRTLFLNKGGLASRNTVHLQRKSFYALSVIFSMVRPDMFACLFYR